MIQDYLWNWLFHARTRFETPAAKKQFRFVVTAGINFWRRRWCGLEKISEQINPAALPFVMYSFGLLVYWACAIRVIRNEDRIKE